LIAVFTKPTPVFAGPTDVSVFVQDATTGRPLETAVVKISAYPERSATAIQTLEATEENATNKLFKAATLDLSNGGRWRIEVAVQDGDRRSIAAFEVDAGEPYAETSDLIAWIAWPFLVVGLFVGRVLFIDRRRRMKRQCCSPTTV
jgi:hypothetical protein